MNRTVSNAQQSTDSVAVAGLVSSLVFWPAGLVLNPAALSRVSSNGKQGKSLAIAGLCISIVGLFLTIILIAATILLAGPVADRALSGAIGAPVTVSDGVTVTTRGLSCTIAEGSQVECEVKATIVNNSDEAITLGPDMMMKAVDVNGRSVTTVEMQSATVQPGKTRETELSITARDDTPWFFPSSNDVGF
ncbi:MAG: DUF4190 domain-containing protein [Homoserinimonas sp.]